MGNTTSEVASGVKAQINSGGQRPELYRFVDMTVNLCFQLFISIKFIFRVVENLLKSCV
jgi:hypothetical protein